MCVQLTRFRYPHRERAELLLLSAAEILRDAVYLFDPRASDWTVMWRFHQTASLMLSYFACKPLICECSNIAKKYSRCLAGCVEATFPSRKILVWWVRILKWPLWVINWCCATCPKVFLRIAEAWCRLGMKATGEPMWTCYRTPDESTSANRFHQHSLKLVQAIEQASHPNTHTHTQPDMQALRQICGIRSFLLRKLV